MVVWPLAQALTRLRELGNFNTRYVIESFKSYEGINSKTVPSGPAFVIISASTSGGLEEKLQKQLASKQVEIWTILGLEPDSQKDKSNVNSTRNEIFIFPRKLKGAPALGGLRDKFEPDVPSIPPGTEAVKVIGERFLSQNVRPKLVKLVHRTLDQSTKIELAKLAQEKIVYAARLRLSGRSRWSISFDSRALIDKYTIGSDASPSTLENWLRNHAFPGSVLIVYPKNTDNFAKLGEEQNEILALRAKGILEEINNKTVEIKVVDHTELDRPSEEIKLFIKNSGVLVICPVISNGFIFKQISASLRNIQPRGPRLYISLAFLPETHSRLAELKADIESNAEDSAYRFKYGLALPIGKIDETIRWGDEYLFLKDIQQRCEDNKIDLPKIFTERIRCLSGEGSLSGELTFLPTHEGKAQPIAPGFLLWTSKTKISGTEYGSAVLLTVAAFLEACRAARAGTGDTSLNSGLFQQTLISPANFTRFNDPAIQAALLRSAYPSEMNYATSHDASLDMGHLIKKLIKLHDAPSGSAVAEFLLALALERLSLEREHHKEVLDEAKKLPGWLGILASKIREN
jgi:hypothetical protein